MKLTRFLPHFALLSLLLVVLGSSGCQQSAPSGSVEAADKVGRIADDQPAQRLAGEKEYEDFASAKFDRPTAIDNPWFPLKPGTRFVWEGTAIDDEGDEEAHSIVFTVTDLVKPISGVPTVVCWDRDFADGELVEAEIVFFAQDNDGNVWHLGQYPEEYEDGNFIAAPCWLHGIGDGKAGIMMKADPKLGTPSYSQGLSNAVNWTDRAVVYQTGQQTKVPVGSFKDVLVIQESDREEPDSQQLKFYARGVGNVRVGWKGEKAGQENLELIKVEQLSPAELAKVREEALKLEKRAYENSKDIYAKTPPATAAPEPARAAPPTGQDAAADNRPPAADQVATAAAPRPPAAEIAKPQDAQPGTEEFGLTKRELVQAVEKVEASIAKYMREQGFEYVAADYKTVRRGMSADKSLPGLSEDEFVEQHGFGLSTLYTGKPPQLAEGYSPAREGLGEQNVQVFKNLSPADQVAYNRALLGENTDATFAVALESEDFSRCGGCTLKAIQQVFKPEQLKASYYNPKDALINKDPRMKAALRKYAAEIREAGFNYNHPDEVEPDIRQQLYAITEGGTLPVEKLSAEQQDALKKLQEYERKVAKVSFDLQEELFEPVEEQIEKEMYAREVK